MSALEESASQCRARARPDVGERGAALLSVILFMIILAGISLLLAGVLLSQITPT